MTEITALEFINHVAEFMDEQSEICRAMGELSPRELKIKFDKQRENILENKKMFLETVGLMGLMGLTDEEKWQFMRQTKADLVDATVKGVTPLLKEYSK